MQTPPISLSSGFTAIELLIATALTAMLCIGLGRFLSDTQRFRARAEVENDLIELNSLLAAELATFMRNYDAQPLHLPPRVHAPGEVRFIDGTANKVMRGSDNVRPAISSKAISFVLPEFSKALQVTGTSGSDSLFACLINGPRATLAEYRTAIALSIDGMTEATFKAVRSAGRPDCFNIHLAGSQGMLLPALQPEILSTVRLIVPIAQEYTMYLSSKGELRYLGHAGEENIENQPIAGKILSFIPSLPTPPDKLLLMVRFEVVQHNSKVAKISLSRFSKVNYEELLFNIS